MIRTFIFGASAAAFIATAAVAAAAELKPDSAASSIEFTAVGKPGFLRINGKDAKVTGSATEAGGTWSGVFTTKLDDFHTGIDMRDEHMKEKYLETKKFPTASLSWSLKTALDSAKELPFEGMLTLHGVEHKVAGTAKLNPAADKKSTKVEATFSIKLSDFGIEIPNFKGITVAEDVEVRTAFEAKGGAGI